MARLGGDNEAMHAVLVGEGIVEVLRYVTDVGQIICRGGIMEGRHHTVVRKQGLAGIRVAIKIRTLVADQR